MTRHPFDPLPFVLGALFVVIAGSFLPGTRSAADLSPAWLWGLPLLGVGLLVVLTGLRRAFAQPDELPRPEEGEEPTSGARRPSEGPRT